MYLSIGSCYFPDYTAQPTANAAAGPDSLAMVAEPPVNDEPIACTTLSGEPPLKRWIFNTGCTDHLNPNRSQFISYTPFETPRSICLGNSSLSPSLGIGTVELDCIVDGTPVKRVIKDVQYVPGMIYGLLAGKCLNRKGLTVTVEDGGCKVIHRSGTVIVEALPSSGRLYFLNLASDSTSTVTPSSPVALTATPSFDLVHKRLAHPGKDALQMMIKKELVNGLKGVIAELKDFTCDACTQGKMIHGPF